MSAPHASDASLRLRAAGEAACDSFDDNHWMCCAHADTGHCIVKGHPAKKAESGLIPILDLLELVLQYWDDYEAQRHTELVNMFNKFDEVRSLSQRALGRSIQTQSTSSA